MYFSASENYFKWLILLTGSVVTMLYGMAVFIATIALPDMMGALSATQDQITWSVTGNIVATAIFTPFAGWLSNRFEIRYILIISVIGLPFHLFIVGIRHPLRKLLLLDFYKVPLLLHFRLCRKH